MIRLHATRRFCFVTFLAVGLLSLAGCGGDTATITSASSKYEVDDGSDAGTSSIPDTPVTPPSAPRVPPGQPGIPIPTPISPPSPAAPASDKPEDLLAYVARLETLEPSGNNRDEMIADFIRMQGEIIGICDRVFAMDVPTDTKLSAARSKVNSLSQMMQLRAPSAAQQLDEFVVTLNASDDEALKQLGFQLAFGNKMQALRAGEEVDPIGVIKDLAHFVATEPKDAPLLEMGGTVAAILEQAGHAQQASEAFRLLAEAFKDAEDESLREHAGELLERAQLLDSDITTMLTELLEGKDEVSPTFVATAQALLQAEGAGLVTLGFFQQVAPTLEVAKPEVAREVYTAIAASFKASPNETLAKMSEQITSSYEIRAALVGQPFVVEGTDLDGEKLDWEKYRGKVVLVDFWATESLVEMSNVRANYDRYHDAGFEVVGVNLDDDLQSLQRFISFQKLPWPSIMGTDPTTRSWNHPLVQKYGVSSIPFLVLVGKDGNVLASNLRGDALGKQLAELFPGVAPTSDPGAAEDIAPAPAPAEPPAPKPAAATPPPAAPATGGAAPAPSATTPSATTPSAPAPQPPANEGAQTGFRRNRRIGGFVGTVPVISPSAPYQRAEPAPQCDEDEKDEEANEKPATEVNPYSPRAGLTARQLIDFIFSMQEKPLSIQQRPGFAAAIAEAADQVLAADASDQFQIVAAEAKFEILHQAASLGDEQADRQLDEFVHQMQDDKRERIAKQVQFFRLERKTLNADEMPLEALPELLEELQTYFSGQKLTDKHLRIASATVHAINRVKDGVRREEFFKTFGAQFGASKDKELARYGKKIGKAPAQPVSDLVGKPLELQGVTALGTDFEWDTYRGKVVVVDFWATWCGPCRRETPHLQALSKTSNKLAIVAISLDRDLEAVEKYLRENQIDWTNLVGDEATELASKCGVRAIPTMLVVDAEGKVVAVGHSVAQIQSKVQQLLSK